MPGMRMVYVSWEYPPQFGGGIGTYVHAIARILARRGHDVTVVTVGQQPYPARSVEDGVLVVRLPSTEGARSDENPRSTRKEPMATLRARQARADAAAEFLAKLVRGGRVDLIEFCDYRGEGAAYLGTTTPAERPVCVTRLHTPMCVLNKYNPGAPRYPVLEEFEQQALRASDRLVSPSAALAREVRAHLQADVAIDLSPYPADPTFLELGAGNGGCEKEFSHQRSAGNGGCGNGGCEKGFSHQRSHQRQPVGSGETGGGSRLSHQGGPGQPAAAGDGREVLYVGRFEERKGVETLAHAAGAFLEACPDARLVMIGGDTVKNPQQPSMRAVVRELIPPAVRGRVELLEPVPRGQLVERYRAARLCVFPSHFENFPNTCLEAMSLGKCVIGTSNSGMAEMIQDGVSGVIVPSGDGAALAQALVRTYQMPGEQRAALGAAARRRMVERYHPDVIAAEHEALYAGYIAAHPYRAAAAVETGAEPVRVAVVVPCYNHGRFVGEAVESVRGQSYPHVECVVVDDGSTDAQTTNALDELRRGGVRVIRQENQGLAAARNTGVRATTAPFFVPLDADDRLTPDFIARLLPVLLNDATLGYAYSHARLFGAAHETWECPAYDPRRLLVENLSTATAVVRRAAFDEVGGYSPDMTHGFEDWDFWLALLAAGYGGQCVPEALFEYRKHAGGSMLTSAQARRGEMVQRMVAHHRDLFARSLEVSLADKDALFFAAQDDAARLRGMVVSGARDAAARPEHEVYDALLAKAELDYIENSRFWRTVTRLRAHGLGRLLLGAERPVAGADPRERLARLKASRAYRLIQIIKHTPVYKWYGRRKYGLHAPDL
jgi:glycosyltransferase involved in cell wall biosynthesis